MDKIAILDYTANKVRIKLLPKRLHNADSEDIEGWLSDKGYSLDNIAYMCGCRGFEEEMTNTDLEKDDMELLAKKTGDELCNCGKYPGFHLIENNCNS